MSQCGFDLSALIAWWRDTEQRLRNQLVAERGATSSAREALAACEERVRQANAARDLALTELTEARDSYAELLDARDAERDIHARAHESMTAHRDKLLADCDRHEREAAELRAKLASVVETACVAPGSTAAVIEAYRLLVGDSLQWRKSPGWFDDTACESSELEQATLHLLHWLDKHAPGVRP